MMKKSHSVFLAATIAGILSVNGGGFAAFGETAYASEEVTEASVEGVDGSEIFGELISGEDEDGPYSYYRVAAGEYELTADTLIEGGLVIDGGSPVTIKLNGYSLIRTDTSQPKSIGSLFGMMGDSPSLTVIGDGGTMSGGYSLYSGGCIGFIGDVSNVKVTIKDTTIENCRSEVPIGAIWANDLTLEGCTIQNCSAVGTGAIGIAGDDKAVLKDCIIRNCSSLTGSIGAIDVGENADLTMENCTIESCTSGTYCGAMSIATGHTGTVTIKDSTITGSTSNSDMQGMGFNNCGTLILSGKVIIRDNSSSGAVDYSRDNLVMGGGGTIDASGLTDGSYIGIYHSSTEDRNNLDEGILIDDLGTDFERVASYFHVDDEDWTAEIRDGEDGTKQLWMTKNLSA